MIYDMIRYLYSGEKRFAQSSEPLSWHPSVCSTTTPRIAEIICKYGTEHGDYQSQSYTLSVVRYKESKDAGTLHANSTRGWISTAF